MITLTEKALQFIKEKNNKPIFLDIPPIIGGCCIHLKESPTVRFGQPHDIQNYKQETIQGVQVYVPYELPDIDLTIEQTSILGFKKLVVEGWRLA